MLLASVRAAPRSLGEIRKKVIRMSTVIKRTYTSSPSSPVLTVTPLHCLYDEPVSIQASGLQPGKAYTLGCDVTDSKGVPFWARVNYFAAADGTIDTALQPAIGGHYSGVQPMGLMANTRLAPTADLPPHIRNYRFSLQDVTKSLSYQLSLYEGGYALHMALAGMEVDAASSVAHTRSLVGPGVCRLPVRHGRVRGVLYLPPGPGPHPGVIDMFGASGGIREYRAALLASRGFAALALPFYKYEDLRPDMSELDMAYFREAVEFLCGREEVDSSGGVGALGASKAGDIALNMALNIPQVTAVVTLNGCISNVETKFELENGKVIPPLMFTLEKVRMLNSGVMDVYEVLNDPLEHPDTVLPVQDLNASVLCVVGEDDRNWKSGKYADLMLERVRGTPAEGLVEVVRYPGAGHLIEPPFGTFCEMAHHQAARTSVLYGGEESAHCAAQVDSWKRILAFFNEKLRSIATARS